MTATQPGMIPCPSCSRPLALPIESVLTGRAIVCAGCGLELTAQRDASRDAMDALGNWYEETASARKAAASAQVPTAKPPVADLPTPKPRRRPRR